MSDLLVYIIVWCAEYFAAGGIQLEQGDRGLVVFLQKKKSFVEAHFCEALFTEEGKGNTLRTYACLRILCQEPGQPAPTLGRGKG